MATRLDSVEKAEILKLYRSGKSMRQIADQLGRSYGTVQRILHGAGVPIRPQGWPLGNKYGRARRKTVPPSHSAAEYINPRLI